MIAFIIPPNELFVKLQFENRFQRKVAKEGVLLGQESGRQAPSSFVETFPPFSQMSNVRLTHT